MAKTVPPLEIDGRTIGYYSYDVPEWAVDRATKRAVTFHARQARTYLAGAISLLREGDEETADTALGMVEEAVFEATAGLPPRGGLKLTDAETVKFLRNIIEQACTALVSDVVVTDDGESVDPREHAFGLLNALEATE